MPLSGAPWSAKHPCTGCTVDREVDAVDYYYFVWLRQAVHDGNVFRGGVPPEVGVVQPRQRRLVGVSGDGVSEDDFVTDLGIRIAVEGFAVGSDGTLFRAGQFDAGDPASFGGGTVFAPIPGLLPNENIRCDSQNTLQQGVFLDRADGQPVGDYQGVAIPYQKFPQFPNG